VYPGYGCIWLHPSPILNVVHRYQPAYIQLSPPPKIDSKNNPN
jgi:hypothetical protein